MTLELRPFVDSDYDAAARIWIECDPRVFLDAAAIRHFDVAFGTELHRERWVIEGNGELVGHGIVSHEEHFHQPGKFVLNLWVTRAARNQGVGAALFERLDARARALAAVQLKTPASETDPQSVRFLEKRGFRETYRLWNSRLKLQGFDISPYRSPISRLQDHGVQIAPLGSRKDDPLHRKLIYEFDCAISKDIPSAPDFVQPSFERFWHSIDKYCPTGESVLVATLQDAYVGVHFGHPVAETSVYMTAYSGVRADWRGRGLATALKALGLEDARKRGFVEMTTWNDSRNAPVLALNARFGFSRQPATIMFQKSL